MRRTRGSARGSASSRIVARARAIVSHGSSMTATSLPQRSQSITTISRSPQDLTSGSGGSNDIPSTPPTSQPGHGTGQITINTIHELCRGMLSKMNGFDSRLKAIEEKQLKLSDALKELHDMTKKLSKESFTIKGTHREVAK